MLISSLPFILQWSPYSLINQRSTNITLSNQVTLCLTSKGTRMLHLWLRYSFLGFNSWLLDLGCYETSVLTYANTSKVTQVLWSLFTLNTAKLLILTLNRNNTSPSSELLFRNARWLEREASEMSGWFFLNKKDRRVLFLIPIFFSTPLKKSFPVGGFYELLLCPITAKLTYKHISWLS